MPFKSEAQRRWMWQNLPNRAAVWEKETKGKLPKRLHPTERVTKEERSIKNSSSLQPIILRGLRNGESFESIIEKHNLDKDNFLSHHLQRSINVAKTSGSTLKDRDIVSALAKSGKIVGEHKGLPIVAIKSGTRRYKEALQAVNSRSNRMKAHVITYNKFAPQIKDEKKANKEYLGLAKKEHNSPTKKLLKHIAGEEAHHAKELKKYSASSLVNMPEVKKHIIKLLVEKHNIPSEWAESIWNKTIGKYVPEEPREYSSIRPYVILDPNSPKVRSSMKTIIKGFHKNKIPVTQSILSGVEKTLRDKHPGEVWRVPHPSPTHNSAAASIATGVGLTAAAVIAAKKWWNKHKDNVENYAINKLEHWPTVYVNSLYSLSRKHKDDPQVSQTHKVLRKLQREAWMHNRGDIWVPQPQVNGHYPIIEKIPVQHLRTAIRANTSDKEREKHWKKVRAATSPFYPQQTRPNSTMNWAQFNNLAEGLALSSPVGSGREPEFLGKGVPGDAFLGQLRSRSVVGTGAAKEGGVEWTVKKFSLQDKVRQLTNPYLVARLERLKKAKTPILAKAINKLNMLGSDYRSWKNKRPVTKLLGGAAERIINETMADPASLAMGANRLKYARNISSNNKLLAAMEYGRKGIPVFPIATDSKRPLTQNGHLSASSNMNTINYWWNKNPDANIGIPTGHKSGIYVVDVDTRNNGHITLANLNKKYGLLPNTTKVNTPGGVHHYFKSSKYIRSKKIGPGIDLKAEGGYVVAPPSKYAKEYTFVNKTNLAELPRWLHE